MKTRLLCAVLAVLMLLGGSGCRGKTSEIKTTDQSASLRPHVLDALEHYENVRSQLAHDELQGVADEARAIAEIAGTLHPKVHAKDQARLAEAREAAERLALSADLSEARLAFAALSRPLVALVAESNELARTHFLFQCPMVEGFNQWIQPSKKIENPYMGQRMPACGTTITWPEQGTAASSGAPGDIAYYTCPMHPSIRQETAGTCPVCGMTLVAVTEEELRTGTITVSAERRQMIGVRVAPAEMKPVRKTLRAVGRIAYDETGLAEVSLKVGGWIETLHADATGMKVRRGAPLFTLYSPELFAAQEEFLTALRSKSEAETSPAPERADYLVEAARNRLRLLDVTDKQLDQIAAQGKPIKAFPFLSPVSGYIIEKNVVAGASVEPKMVLFRIADLDRVWIEAEFFTAELELVKPAAQAVVTLPYLPGQQVAGRVAYVYPYLDPTSRTGRVRIELENKSLELKPDMYANVELQVDLGNRLVVPKSAVLPAGDRQFVFLDLGAGKLRPQRVELGAEAGDDVEVTSGLKPGDPIVVSGNFLIAAESRLKTALEQW